MDIVRLDQYGQVKFTLYGHGPRDVSVLMHAFDEVNSDELSDIYGKGEIIEAFQDKMAKLLGKPAAVFFPSGTMAQQIALRQWCDDVQSYKVAYHPLCHLEIHEQDGLKKLHPIKTVLIGQKNKLFTLDEVKNLGNDVKVLLIELPQREVGGLVPTYNELTAISAYCKEEGIKLHLDGARLLEVLPYYEKSAAEICALFDSVYMSFYKGIGSLAGAVLAGPEDFGESSKIWKRRYGGDLISLYPYIIPADYHYELRKDRFKDYYELARLLAYKLNQCPGIKTVPKIPQSNMFHTYINHPIEEVKEIFETVYKETDIGLVPMLRKTEDGTAMFEYAVGDLLGRLSAHQLDKFCMSLKTAMTDKEQ